METNWREKMIQDLDKNIQQLESFITNSDTSINLIDTTRVHRQSLHRVKGYPVVLKVKARTSFPVNEQLICAYFINRFNLPITPEDMDIYNYSILFDIPDKKTALDFIIEMKLALI